MMKFLKFAARSGHVDIVPAQPYLCRNLWTAMAFILLAFLPLNLGLPVSHSIWRMTPRHRNGTATRHGELMGNPDQHSARLQDRRNRTYP